MMNIDSETLRSKITCFICNKHYRSPKTLACLHSFCLDCLKAIAVTKNEGHSEISVSCPQCKKAVSYSSVDALNDLQHAFQKNRVLAYHKFKQQALGQMEVQCQKCITKKVKGTAYCTSCAKFICDLCLQIHQSWTELKNHQTLKLSQLKDTYQKYAPIVTATETCAVHSNICSIYCETCDVLVCHECIVKGIHRDHEYYHSEESAKRHTKEVVQKLDTINHLPTQLQSAITIIDEISENFTSQSKNVEKQMNQSFTSAFQNLTAIKERKTKDLTQYTAEKMKTLNTQKESLERMMVKTSNTIDFIADATDGSHITEFFLLRKLMSARIQEISEEFTKLNLTPTEEPEVHFSCNAELSEAMAKSMRLSDGSVLHAGSSEGRNFAVGEVICFYIALSSAFYKTKTNPMEELQANIQSVRDGNICPATVVVSSNGFAKLQCSFSERGRYTLNVKIADNHINGSPYKFYIKANGSQLQKSIKSISKLSFPKAVAINSKYQMVICEENKHSVSVFGRKAKKLISVGEYGKEKGKFNHPTGVAVDSKDYIYIVDSKNDRIQKFDPEGRYMGEYKGDKGKNTHLHLPSTIKYGHHDGNLYVVDRGNCRVIILNQKLEYIYLFGSSGYGLGALQDPWDLAFDRNGFVYITDQKQHCIHIYTSSGSFRGKIGNQGQQKGKLNHPTGIAIDRFGKIYVCESGNHRVSIFHESSEFINCFSIGLEMVNPCGIAVDDDGFLYVASSEAVHVF